MALILFYLHKEPNTFEDVAKYWKYIEILEKAQLIPAANIPLQLK